MIAEKQLPAKRSLFLVSYQHGSSWCWPVPEYPNPSGDFPSDALSYNFGSKTGLIVGRRFYLRLEGRMKETVDRLAGLLVKFATPLVYQR